MRAIIQSLTLCLFIAGALGCGGESYGPTGVIEGKLSMDGKPMSAGYAVSFMQMQSGFLAYGMTDADGNYKVSSWNNGNMPIGKYDIMIAPPSGESADDAKLSAEDRFDKQQTTGKARSPIPARYRDTTTSGLTFEVKEGKNHFDIDLKPK